jgi:hypothetical protein
LAIAKLPNADRAIIDERKITGCLLDLTHPFGRAKATLFMRFRFVPENWQRLRDALAMHAGNNEFATSMTRRHGVMYEVVGPLYTPDGRNPRVRVAWMIRHGEDLPRLVTAVPA